MGEFSPKQKGITMRKEIEKLQANMSVKSISNFGRFTVAEVEYENEGDSKRIIGVGISKRGHGDTYRPLVGNAIAISRAKKGIYKKLKNQTINELFVG